MKHQWLHFQAFPPDEGYVACVACGKAAAIINGHVGVAIVTSDCEEGHAAATELLSTPTLVQIDEDLWVNPALVASVAKDRPDVPGNERITTLAFASGTYTTILRPMSEVVALINGSAE